MTEWVPAGVTRATVGARSGPRVCSERLVWRLYRSANLPLRARLLACLVRPLSPLALVAVAAGAFAGVMHRRGASGSPFAIEDVARYTHEQVTELARFVEQVQPQALQDFATLVADSGAGTAAFTTAVAVVLMRTVQQRQSARRSG